MLNHALGQYVMAAFNEPKKYPKEPFLYRDKQNKIACFATDADLDRFISKQVEKRK